MFRIIVFRKLQIKKREAECWLINKRKIYWIMVLSEAGGQTIRYWEPWRANIPTNGFIITDRRPPRTQPGDQTENISNNLGQYQEQRVGGIEKFVYVRQLCQVHLTSNLLTGRVATLWSEIFRNQSCSPLPLLSSHPSPFHVADRNNLWEVKKETFFIKSFQTFEDKRN